jgi:DnaJ-class molecular chaperone
MERPDGAIDCECCEGSGKYPIHTHQGKLKLWIECPDCCGAGHDYGDAAEEFAAEQAKQFEMALVAKYENALAEMRANPRKADHD